jgi:hypothetical protein
MAKKQGGVTQDAGKRAQILVLRGEEQFGTSKNFLATSE